MRNLFILLKVNLDEEMGISSFHHQRSARGKISGLLKRAIMLLLGVVIIGLFYTLGHRMASTGFADAIPVFAYIIGSILTLIITILKINETLAGKADTEFVMSLPINNFIQVFCLFLPVSASLSMEYFVCLINQCSNDSVLCEGSASK